MFRLSVLFPLGSLVLYCQSPPSSRFDHTKPPGQVGDQPKRSDDRQLAPRAPGLFSDSLNSGGGSGQHKRARESHVGPPPSGVQRHDKMARGSAADSGKHGKFGVTDENRLICVGTTSAKRYIPTEMGLLSDLIDAGINVDWLVLEGSHLLECIRVNDLGERTRTWRLVTHCAASKAALMRQFKLVVARLSNMGLKVSDWTWAAGPN